ncbi:MAG: glutathione S-transferase family protein [Alphaproteobacteria bacterium]|nr:glutathione S-transferase family protein [Alphaproteobacteria bacterium]
MECAPGASVGSGKRGTAMLTLYDNMDSGNGYKARLLLHKLGVAYTRVELDIDRSETRTANFLVKNPNGRIPTLELDDGTYLAESNAIIHYLAEDSPYLPADRLKHAQVLQWMFFEQYSHEPYVATPRYIVRHLGRDHARMNELPDRHQQGHAALAVMDQHLAKRRFFVDERLTIADIALYAYTHVAYEGDLDIGRYGNVRTWLDQVAAEPRHIPITQEPITPG